MFSIKNLKMDWTASELVFDYRNDIRKIRKAALYTVIPWWPKKNWIQWSKTLIVIHLTTVLEIDFNSSGFIMFNNGPIWATVSIFHSEMEPNCVLVRANKAAFVLASKWPSRRTFILWMETHSWNGHWKTFSLNVLQ